MPARAALLLRHALRGPLTAVSALLGLLFLLWKRPTRLARASRRRACHEVLIAGGRVVFGDTLPILLGHWDYPGSERSVNVHLELSEGAPLKLRPAANNASEGGSLRLSVAYLTAEGALRRELLFAWSLGCQLAAGALRRCSREPALAPMRAAAVVLPYLPDRDALLVTRRAASGGSYNSMWVFPGGAIDPGESPEIAGARELLEETGLVISPSSLRPLCLYQARNENFCLTYLMLIYSGSVESGTLRLQRKEVAEAAFLPRKMVGNLLAQEQTGELEGFVHGSEEGSLMSRPVPLADLHLAKDGAIHTGPGMGGGHWFALREWHGQSAKLLPRL